MDTDKLKEFFHDAPPPRASRTVAEIDETMTEIQDYLAGLIDQTVPWAKPSEWAKPFWDPECDTATNVTRRLRTIWNGDRTIENWKT